MILLKRVYEYRRHLPHYQRDYKAIFVTFSTHHRWILPAEARTITLQACLWGNGKRFTLHGVVIMPDHTHLVFTPWYDGRGFYSIAEIMQGIKSVSAHRINRALNRVGQIWQHESFDHVLRREESIETKVQYISENPVRAGLVNHPQEYRWLWSPELIKSAQMTRTGKTPAPTSQKSM